MDNAADMDTALAMEYVMDMGNANRNTFRENGQQLEALVFTLKAARALALAVNRDLHGTLAGELEPLVEAIDKLWHNYHSVDGDPAPDINEIEYSF